jgi:hypothetical protein
MPHHDPIALWLGTSLGGGLAAHVAITVLYRRNYRRLRAAYVGAVADAQETGAPGALVRAQELHRQFMRATVPGWFTGLGARIRSAFVLCAIAGIAVMVAAGRLPPAVAGVALLFAIGFRRILLATALLVAIFAVTSLTSGPPDSPAATAATTTHAHPARPPAPPRPRSR